MAMHVSCVMRAPGPGTLPISYPPQFHRDMDTAVDCCLGRHHPQVREPQPTSLRGRSEFFAASGTGCWPQAKGRGKHRMWALLLQARASIVFSLIAWSSILTVVAAVMLGKRAAL